MVDATLGYTFFNVPVNCNFPFLYKNIANPSITQVMLIHLFKSKFSKIKLSFLPLFANITIDKGTTSEGNYNTFIGPKGNACIVVATWRGYGEVSIPDQDLTTQELAVSKK